MTKRPRLSNTRAGLSDDLIKLHPELLAYGTTLTGNRPLAEDLANDTIVKALEAVNQFQDGSNTRSWVFTIMTNHYRSGRRRSWRWTNETDYFAGTAESRDQQLEFKDVLVAPDRPELIMEILELRSALKHLSRKNRQALLLAASGYDMAEIAKKLKIAEGTVKSRVGRARQDLRTMTGQRREDEAARY
jgi:RNA polymerase sigma-70 factor (ECF subfamily)